MSETEFLEQAEMVFSRIQSVIDASGIDVECTISEAVMEIEFDDGAQVIVNRHTPNRELWIAARSGGFHYAWRDGEWRNTRDDSEFFSSLANLITKHSGKSFAF